MRRDREPPTDAVVRRDGDADGERHGRELAERGSLRELTARGGRAAARAGAGSVGPVSLVRLPEPFSFELSTERFRAFGADLANLWHEGGLHRVVDGREVRIEAGAAGVRVDPLDETIEREVRYLLGEPFDLNGFAAWARSDEVLAPLVVRFAGFRPPLAPDPWEMLVGSITAQQVSMFAAVAIRNRFIERFGERHEHAYSFPVRDRVAGAGEDELFALGFSRRKSEYVLGLARARVDLHSLAVLPDDEIRAAIHVAARAGGVDGRLVPRPPPGPSDGVAVR